MADIERRVVTREVTIRAAQSSGDVVRKLEGYAAVFNSETVIWDAFREVILPGAFADRLQDDVRGLFNHDANYVLGRTTNGTLALSEDDTGLKYAITLNDADPDAERVSAKVARGDVSQSSFAFSVDPDGEEWDYSETKIGKMPLRKIVKFAELYDVSPVTFPAFEDTTVSARAKQMSSVTPEVPVELRGVAADTMRRRYELDTIRAMEAD